MAARIGGISTFLASNRSRYRAMASSRGISPVWGGIVVYSATPEISGDSALRGVSNISTTRPKWPIGCRSTLFPHHRRVALSFAHFFAPQICAPLREGGSDAFKNTRSGVCWSPGFAQMLAIPSYVKPLSLGRQEAQALKCCALSRIVIL